MTDTRVTAILLATAVLALALLGATSQRTEALTPQLVGVPVGDSAQKLLDRAVAYLVVRAYSDALAGMQASAKPLCAAVARAAQARVDAALNTQLKSMAGKHVEGVRAAVSMLSEAVNAYVTAKHCAPGANPAVTDLAALKSTMEQVAARLGAGLAKS